MGTKKKKKSATSEDKEVKQKQAKGEKTRKALIMKLSLKLGIEPDDIDDATLARLQEEE